MSDDVICQRPRSKSGSRESLHQQIYQSLQQQQQHKSYDDLYQDLTLASRIGQSLLSQNHQLQLQLESSTGALQSVNGMVKDLETALDLSISRCNELEQDRAALTAELDECRSRILDLERALKNSSRVLQDAENLENHIADLTNSNDQLSSTLMLANQQVNESCDQQNHLLQLVESLNDEINGLVESRAELKRHMDTKIKEWMERYNAAEVENEKLRSVIKKKGERRARSLREAKTLSKTSVLSSQDSMLSLETYDLSLVEALRKQVAELKTEQKELGGLIEILRDEKSALEQQVGEYEAQFGTLEAEIDATHRPSIKFENLGAALAIRSSAIDSSGGLAAPLNQMLESQERRSSSSSAASAKPVAEEWVEAVDTVLGILSTLFQSEQRLSEIRKDETMRYLALELQSRLGPGKKEQLELKSLENLRQARRASRSRFDKNSNPEGRSTARSRCGSQTATTAAALTSKQVAIAASNVDPVRPHRPAFQSTQISIPAKVDILTTVDLDLLQYMWSHLSLQKLGMRTA
ncbi:uncharacterized protein BJ171DRAFT_599290 [Polychytrium aggregatum]|uniref:uncharacterized protein n=1 Tax=Polychytrium aggregatum TaxID=110093 RepID=UPI0022FF2DFB|nr:uncharacterized protein BJ171DRAFT_599290 [Polychytrium aggregatum]KAI9204504.1 hypothetical protein BJ171DRAFT_599290 [Polychytrium aggregatum]